MTHDETDRARFHDLLTDPATAGKLDRALAEDARTAPDDVPDYQVIEAMIQYGGSFVARLGQAALCADHVNLARLRDAFPDYWRQYAEMVRLKPVRRSEGTEP